MLELTRIESDSTGKSGIAGTRLRFRFVDERGEEFGIETIFPLRCLSVIVAGTLIDLAEAIKRKAKQ